MRTEEGKEALVSVIIPAYNAEKYISETIESVVAQTYRNLEVLVIDDASSDRTAEIAEQFSARDSRIRVVRKKKNQGVVDSRNAGLEQSSGDYVALLDSDDLWYPEKLKKQVEAMEKSGADLSCTDYDIVDEKNQRRLGRHRVKRSFSYEDMLICNFISCSTVVLSRRAAERYRFSDAFFHEDYALWLQILKDGCKAVGVDEVLGAYRFYSSSKSGNKLRSARHRWRIYRQMLHFPVRDSLRYSLGYIVNSLRKYGRSRR